MTSLFPILSGLLAIAAGFGHSYLGERRILRPLFAEGTPFLQRRRMRDLLRAVWHLPSLAWIGLGGLLVHAGVSGGPDGALALAAGAIFLLSGLANWAALRSFHIGGVLLVAAGALLIASIAGI